MGWCTISNILIYVEYMTLYESVDIGAIKDEIIEYENRIKDKLYRNQEEKTLSVLLRKASILSDLLEIKLTSNSLEYFKNHRNEFNPKDFSNFIKTAYRKYKIAIPEDLDITGIFDAIGFGDFTPLAAHSTRCGHFLQRSAGCSLRKLSGTNGRIQDVL